MYVQELKGRSGSKMSVGQIPNIQEALRPILDEQKKINERIGKLNHSIEVSFIYNQKQTNFLLYIFIISNMNNCIFDRY